MSTITLDKKYKYRNGEPARILAIDTPGNMPVVSVTVSGLLIQHNPEGGFFRSSPESIYDLIEVREPRECWVNYHSEQQYMDERQYDSKEKAAFCQRKPMGPCEQIHFREVLED